MAHFWLSKLNLNLILIFQVKSNFKSNSNSLIKDNTLLEYDSLEDINSRHISPKIYHLPSFFYGTGHVVYQGALFYHSYNTRNLIKYDLHLNRITAVLALDVPRNDTQEETCRVYSDHRDHVGCVDFNVDENGAWLVYRNASRQNIFVAKLNVEDLSFQKRTTVRFGNKENSVKLLVNIFQFSLII